MKNIQTILLGLFATITLTESCYPIIFTDPAQRQAHREQAEQAYADGVDSGENQSEDLSVDQALYDAGLEDVNIQAVEAPTLPMNPTAPAAQVPAASTEHSDDPMAALLAATPHTTPAPVVTPTLAFVTPSPAAAPVVPAVHAAPAPAVAVMPAIPTPVATPAVAAPIVAAPVPSVPTASVISPVVAPVEPLKSTSAEKVVKVYPVFDAVRLAMHHVYEAAQDMISYAYSLVTAAVKPAKELSPADAAANAVKPATEKSEAKA